jgi:TolA-binding protein
MADYHAALSARRLGPAEPMRSDELQGRVAAGEALLADGRHDEAVALLTDLTASPRFVPYANDDLGRAALYFLGDALFAKGAYGLARTEFRAVRGTRDAWKAPAIYARRSARRSVDIALESGAYESVLAELSDIPPTAPEDVRAELDFLKGRAAVAAGKEAEALAAFGRVPPTSRHWASATYLAGVLHAEAKRYKDAEAHFCRVADPKLQRRTAAMVGDARFFEVRDRARLGLGRVAHEERRHDDARYYYYLVPKDSGHLPEALYEAATTRYEKKDYEGARELLDELHGLGVHHRYEDESRVLDAYVDVALCRFESGDAKLRAFLANYEPVRDGVRRVSGDARALDALLRAVREGTDAGATAEAGGLRAEELRYMAAVLRVDGTYMQIARRRAVVERERQALSATRKSLQDIGDALGTNGGLRPSAARDSGPDERARVKEAVEALERALTEAQSAGASPAALAPLRMQLVNVRVQLSDQRRDRGLSAAVVVGAPAATASRDLPSLVAADAARVGTNGDALDGLYASLLDAERLLARDTLRRLELRLSRLLRRARLGRIETVLGRKRALELEVEAIGNGFLPAGAVDSLDVARYLKDSEEYWPFEGDDWPDEYVGREVLR